MAIETIKWVNGCGRIIDQRKLPMEFKYIFCRDERMMWDAIKTLAVRGAPAIGVAAAFGVLLGLKKFKGSDKFKFYDFFGKLCDYIGSSRPTAVNLFNMLDRMKDVAEKNRDRSIPDIKELLHKEAIAIYNEDRKVCRRMGDFGAQLVQSGKSYMTVCNAGALATVDYGTALGVFYSAKKMGKKFKVFSCETRPLLQGARLTTWELLKEKIDTTLICDNMAAAVMRQGKVSAVFAGADRIASNGDTANKIGTYSLAVLAKHHGIPLYIVAPRSTFDLKIKSGKQIPIEERSSDEVTHFRNVQIAPSGVKVFNPAFDVTDHSLIAGIVTEYGIIRPSFEKNIKKAFKI